MMKRAPSGHHMDMERETRRESMPPGMGPGGPMPPGMPPIFPPPGMDHEGFQKWQAAVASFYEQHHGPGGMDPSGGPPPGFPPGLYMWQGQPMLPPGTLPPGYGPPGAMPPGYYPPGFPHEFHPGLSEQREDILRRMSPPLPREMAMPNPPRGFPYAEHYDRNPYNPSKRHPQVKNEPVIIAGRRNNSPPFHGFRYMDEPCSRSPTGHQRSATPQQPGPLSLEERRSPRFHQQEPSHPAGHPSGEPRSTTSPRGQQQNAPSNFRSGPDTASPATSPRDESARKRDCAPGQVHESEPTSPSGKKDDLGQRQEGGTEDKQEAKRQRRKQSNRESARRSRQRKQMECDELSGKITRLKQTNLRLANELSGLNMQRDKLLQEHKNLEAQLSKEEPLAAA